MTTSSDPGKEIGLEIATITDELVAGLEMLAFAEPVTHVYNPLVYAREGYDRYVTRFGGPPKSVILLGMNPGPFGMAQTGVPFGDVFMVREWMGLSADIGRPPVTHPKRPIAGFGCVRSEVSGRRLWEWARQRFGGPDDFFRQFFVVNYCPLIFIENGGRNRTPDKLRSAEKSHLFAMCDKALRQTIAVFQPRWVVGIGGFAEARAREALDGLDLNIGRIAHPSPANPRANRGWAQLVESELAGMGIRLPNF